MISDEALKELLTLEVPNEIESAIVENETLYPRVNKFNTISGIQTRFDKLVGISKKTKDVQKKIGYRNEMITLTGKRFLMEAKKSNILANLKYCYISLLEVDIYEDFGAKVEKDEEAKESEMKDLATATALYFCTGKKIMEHAKKAK